MEQAFGDLVIGLIGAAITALAALCWRLSSAKIAHSRAVRRYPISATYLSSYTDELDGVVRTVKDEVSIKQRALKFTGSSRNIATGRSFQIEGEILDGRHLTGVYGGQNTADDASGVFFMTMDAQDSSHIKGFWAGFGSEKRQVLSGAWAWRKKLEVALHTEQPTPAEAAEAAALFNDSFGAGFTREKDLVELSGSDSGILVQARDTAGELMGAATARILDEMSTAGLEQRLRAAGVHRAGLEGQSVGELRSSAVVPHARGRGVGLDLVRKRLDYLKAQGCTYAVCASWAPSRGGSSSQGILNAVGFEIVAVIPRYWAEEQKIEQYLCSVCGQDCECEAIIMKRTLYDWKASSTEWSGQTVSSRLARR